MEKVKETDKKEVLVLGKGMVRIPLGEPRRLLLPPFGPIRPGHCK